MTGARGRARRAVAIALVAVSATAVVAACTPPDTPGPGSPLAGLALPRPRIAMRPGDVAIVQARLEREPYRTLFARLHGNTRSVDGVALDDDSIAAERIKARGAKDLAFEYAVERTAAGGAPVPFASAADRAAVAARARTLLLGMYTRSRLDVPPPLGGHDRDINTSEELLQYATAYDTMRGAGYSFGSEDAAIRANLTALAAELYADFRFPEQHRNYTLALPNNHRSKSAAALGVAGIVLADYPPAAGTDPDGTRDPANWLRFGLDQVDLVERWLYNPGDGTYGEGAYYQRYAGQNLLPFLRAWDRLTDGRSIVVDGHEVPSLYREPSWRATQRWMLDMTLPDGTLAPIDDSNPGFGHYFGALDQSDPNAAAFAWRWANQRVPFDAEGSVDLAADQIVAYDDTAVVPAPPTGSPTRFYTEGGHAIFRSDWGSDAVVSVLVGEHGAAAELGRDRDGLGRLASAAHEQAEPGSVLLHAFGERLLLDPGYLTYGTRMEVGKPQDHNIVVVDGAVPADPFIASLVWQSDFAGPPPLADGQATMSDVFDTDFLDGARVTTRYGPAAAPSDVSRRLLFVDDRYAVAADTVTNATGAPSTYTWLWHGNGGGTSGGTFASLPTGARWERSGARLDAAFVADGATAPVAFGAHDANHEVENRVKLTHTALSANATGNRVRAFTVLYPSRAGEPAPTTTGAGTVASPLVVDDAAGDRRVALWRDHAARGTTGSVRLLDTHTDGSLRLAYARRAQELVAGGVTVRGSRAGNLAARLEAGRLDVYADGAGASVFVAAPFPVGRVDGACKAVSTPTGTLLTLGRERRVTLWAANGNGVPAADAGGDRGVEPGTTLRLNGRRSCDPEGHTLTPWWRLVAAAPGSTWELRATADPWRPALVVDRPGSYRVELTVTDADGAVSRPDEIEVWTTPLCAGDRLQWNDPRCRAVPDD